MDGQWGARPAFGTEGWTGTYTTSDGLITIVVNDPDEEFYIDARQGHSPKVMRSVLAMARHHGLELMDEDECEPELLEDGTVRLYLVQGATPAAPVQPVKVGGRTKVVKRSLAGLALAACVTGGVLMPSPMRTDYDLLHFRVIPEHDTLPKHQHLPENQGVSTYVMTTDMKGQ
ncbi:hypothetical protein KGG72_gp25 [Streptomyces phage Salutena]|uniref:Uncharacterized protein n=1 Tax=Streptomyces phage Salutena TaxID=2767576 RepID=A0A7S6R701_9CAUD|nr:hypothetical protein KGG72_gp25 [Streptomyces phage Salutena]QOV06155.1 hypothetical protein CPT_Salutena_025 [Streptomyces phage Salutena]